MKLLDSSNNEGFKHTEFHPILISEGRCCTKGDSTEYYPQEAKIMFRLTFVPCLLRSQSILQMPSTIVLSPPAPSSSTYYLSLWKKSAK